MKETYRQSSLKSISGNVNISAGGNVKVIVVLTSCFDNCFLESQQAKAINKN